MIDQSKQVSVALTQHEIDIVQEQNALKGINNFSATLRMIIREWARVNQTKTTTTGGKGNGHES